MIIQATCERLPFAAESIDHIFTDPPYLRKYLPCYDWLAQEAARVLKPGGFVAALCADVYLDQIFSYFLATDLTFYFAFHWGIGGQRASVVWMNRNGFSKPIVIRAKTLLVYSRGDHAISRTAMGQRYNGSGKNKIYHEWGQDVEASRYFVDCLTHPGQLILDPFIGGGTTAVACEAIGRRWIGCDVDPKAIAATRRHLADARQPYRNLPLFADQYA